MSTPEFTPTNQVEAALAAARADPEKIPTFLAALAESRVEVPVTELPGEDGLVSFPTFESRGSSFIGVYTSPSAVTRAGRDGEPRVALTGRDLAKMWPAGVNMSINPGAGPDIALPGAVIDELTRGSDGVGGKRIPAGTQMTVGRPAKEPVELLQRLSVAASEWPGIRALHLALVRFDDSGDPPQFIIGVDVDPDAPNVDEALHVLARAAGTEASLLPLRPGATDPFNSFVQDQNSPFYSAG